MKSNLSNEHRDTRKTMNHLHPDSILPNYTTRTPLLRGTDHFEKSCTLTKKEHRDQVPKVMGRKRYRHGNQAF